MQAPLKIFLRSVVLIVCCCLFFVLLIECYNPFSPYIDTRFSTGFDENIFNQIKIGDSADSVVSRLGSPIWKLGCDGCWNPDTFVKDNVFIFPTNRPCDTACNAEYQYWQFSDDGACTWWDFAWKYFSLDIKDNIVVDKHAWWVYD